MRWQKKSYSVSLRVSIAIAICRLSWGRMKSIYWEKVFWSPAVPVALTKYFGGPGRLFGSAVVHGLFSSVLLHTISIYWFSWGGERVGSLDPAVALTKTLLGAISHAIGIFWFSWGESFIEKRSALLILSPKLALFLFSDCFFTGKTCFGQTDRPIGDFSQMFGQLSKIESTKI